MSSWNSLLIGVNDSLESAIKVLNQNELKIVLVVDDNQRLLGTVTDGDIRRALLNGSVMSDNISLIMNDHPTTADESLAYSEIVSLMLSKGLVHMPIVDKNGALCGLETTKVIGERSLYDNPVFLMAGGIGKRLQPLTNEVPKPLLKIGGVPILETILNQFISAGFHNFYISVYYKAEMIENYFGDGSKWNVSIRYIREKEPLGTAGCLGLVPRTGQKLPMILINGDILTQVNFEQLLNFHIDSDSNATMCVREYDFQVPYGVVQADNGFITNIVEKPVHKFFVNAGVYVLDPMILDAIDGSNYLDMPNLLESEIRNGNKVSMFPIHEYWLDIGQMEQFEKAQQDSQRLFI